MRENNRRVSSLFILLFTTIASCFAAAPSSASENITYTRSQVDSLITMEVRRQVDTQLIDLKIQKASNDILKTYISEENNHLSFLAIIITILVAIVGIVIPLFLNRVREATIKKMEKDINKVYPTLTELKFLTELVRALNNTDIDVKIFSLSQIIDKYPSTQYVSYAYNSRGCEYDEIKEYEKAIADYTKAIDLNPQYAEAYNNRGNAYCAEGEDRQALNDYNKAINLNPNYATAYGNRSDIFVSKGMFREAQKDIEKALKLNPYSDNAYFRYANLLFIKKDYNGALENVNKAIKINNAKWERYNLRSFIFFKKGQYSDALNDAKESLEIAKLQIRDKNVFSAISGFVKLLKGLIKRNSSKNVDDFTQNNNNKNENKKQNDNIEKMIMNFLQYLIEYYKDYDGRIPDFK